MAEATLADVDVNRARLYGLLAALLARPPSAETLALVAGLGDGPGILGRAIGDLGRAAAGAAADPDAVRREYGRLFVGLTRGELVPYASWYRTGFLQDRPLMAIRADLGRLGLTRAASVPEPEDHIAALLDAMAALIDGRAGAPAGEGEQQRFFEAHLAPFAARFFADLESADAATFYAAVGTLGRVLTEVEQQAFALA
jgi:TorA maturation chaperone TorD